MSGPIRDLIWESPDHEPRARVLRKPAIYLLLLSVVLILGINWPIMATGLREITPIWMGVFRVAGALLVVLVITTATDNIRVPPRSDLPMIASLALFRLALVFILVFSALKLVPAGRSSVVVWTTSLWTVPIASVWLGERVSGRKWLGLVIGISGVLVLAQPWGSQWTDPRVAWGHVLLILAAITNAATAVHIRAHRWTITPLQAIPWQLVLAAVPLVALALAVEGPPAFDWTPQLWVIVAYQGMVATGIAFWAQIVVLRNLSPVSTNLTLMAVPVVGVISSAIALGEEITTALLVGMVMVIAGVSLSLLADRGRADGGDQPGGVSRPR